VCAWCDELRTTVVLNSSHQARTHTHTHHRSKLHADKRWLCTKNITSNFSEARL